MQQQISATRMELMNYKKRLVLAKRGHKLLKDKRDEMMRQFMLLIEDYRDLRSKVETALSGAFQGFIVARSGMANEFLEEALLTSKDKISMTVSKGNIMNIKIPKMSLEYKGDIIGYGFSETSGDLDYSLKLFADALPLMVRLSEKEKAIQLLAVDIEKTRRRVNALEHVMVPFLEDALHQIVLRLGEIERSALTRLMKVKDIVRKH